MRAELAAAERLEAVRESAREWRKIGFIDEELLGTIAALHPDHRVRVGLVWRTVVFFLVSVAIGASFGAFAAFGSHGDEALGAVALMFGLALAGAAEFLQGPMRHSGTGAESAASFWSVAFLLASAGLLIHPRSLGGEDPFITFLLGLSALLWSLACWRWAFPVYALFGAASAFFAAGRLTDHPRIAWIVLGAVLTAAAERMRRRSTLAPSQRASIAVLLAVGLLGLYAALNRYSLDRGLVESLCGAGRPGPAGPATAAIAAAATSMFPLILLAAGLRTRRRLLLDAGILAAALSLATLRFYIHLGPLWEVLLVSGAAAMAIAIGIERWLSKSPGGERFGFTAAPFFSGERAHGVLLAAAAATTLAPSPGRPEPGESKGFTGEGGGFGGGGATGEF